MKKFNLEAQSHQIISPNLINRNFETFKKENVWYTDITYLLWKKARYFLSVILDGKTKDIVAFHFSSKHN